MARDLLVGLSNRGSRIFPLETLCEEFVCLVLAHVDDLTDLCNMSLVSRRLYLLTVAILYRHVVLEEYALSHEDLLERLGHPRSRIPKHIRTIDVPVQKFLDENYPQKCKHIQTTLLGVKNLKTLKWGASIPIPLEILDLIAARLPTANVALRIYCGNLSELHSATPYTIFAHPASSQITRFEYTANSADSFYGNFKRDVTNMIKNSQCLVHFKITSYYRPTITYPEYIGRFRGDELPHLKQFILKTPETAFFTNDELDLWGAKCGWERLSTLELHYVELFWAFIGRTPNLTQLKLGAPDFEVVQDIEVRLDTITVDLFPQLLDFSLTNSAPMLLQGRHAVPLKLLKRMSQLESLSLLSLPMDNAVISEFCPDVPNFRELREIRKCCPRLENLSIAMNRGGPYARWPRPFLLEVESIEKLDLLTLPSSIGNKASKDAEQPDRLSCHLTLYSQRTTVSRYPNRTAVRYRIPSSRFLAWALSLRRQPECRP